MSHHAHCSEDPNHSHDKVLTGTQDEHDGGVDGEDVGV
jgi:hypothetical protein